MGQYYKPYIERDEEKKTYCTWDYDNSAKLTDHSYIGNNFVSGVLHELLDNPARVAWVGDYADEDSDFAIPGYTKEIYDFVWNDEDGSNICKFSKDPERIENGYLVNKTKKVAIDLAEYLDVCGEDEVFDNQTYRWAIHPLPLLCAIGNGRGGGDYHTSTALHPELVGTWAMDEIYYTRAQPDVNIAVVDAAAYMFKE